MVISNENLRVDTWTAVKTCLVAANLRITNLTTSVTTAASVVSKYNAQKTTTPQVAIEVPNKQESEFKFGEARGRMFINVTIEVFATKPEYISQLTDQIDTALSAYDFGNMDIVSITSDTAFIDPNLKDFHVSTIVVTFDKG